jgi:anti-sigma regulatory factor (Ser/Thr protein kinase)
MTSRASGRGAQVTGAGGGFEAGAVVLDESFDAATLHLLRESVAACAAAVGMPQGRATEVMLALHELAANVVRHGAGSGRLVMRATVGALRCLVSDAGPGAGPWPVRQGHGLWIVRAVADQVTVSSGSQGSQVAAVFRWQGEAGGDGPGRKAT